MISIPTIGAAEAVSPTAQFASTLGAAQPSAPGASFGQMLLDGVQGVNQKLIDADQAVTAFALDDSIPLHQVTYALEQSRLAFELMLQVRARLVEGYQEIMRMQL